MENNYEQKQNNSNTKIIIAVVVLVLIFIVAVGSVIIIQNASHKKEVSSALAVESQVSNIIKYADALASKGDYDEAIAAIDSGLLNHPDSTELLEKKLEYSKLKEKDTTAKAPDTAVQTTAAQTIKNSNNNNTILQYSNDSTNPFYAICCSASKDLATAEKSAANMRSQGFNASVVVTTDWSNLNSEKWYVVTAGRFKTKDDANSVLKQVQKSYKDAYVKYSGNYQGSVCVTTTKANSACKTPFYAICCSASKDSASAEKFAANMRSQGFSASVVVTTDWSNLNSEKWYVVTAGTYQTKGEAESALSKVKTVYKDAYVKYSGDYIG